MLIAEGGWGSAAKAYRHRLTPRFAPVRNGLRQGRQPAFKEFPNLFIIGLFGQDLVASENPPSIGIHHKDGMIAGVEQDGIGSFRADAMQVEKLFAKPFRRTGKQLSQRALIPIIQKRDKKF